MRWYYSTPMLVVMALVTADVVSAWLARARTSQKVVALEAGYDERRFSHAIRGDKPLNLHKLLACRPDLIRALGEVLIEMAGGEPPLTRRALRVELAHVSRLVTRAESRTERRTA